MPTKYLDALGARKSARSAAIAIATGVFLSGGGVSTNAEAGSCSSSHYGGTDIDCAIILCLVGGFGPSECNAAYGCFWHRLTRVPPKPPVGFCPMGSLEHANLADDDEDVFEQMLRELEGFDYPEGVDTLRSVRATIYRHTKTCSRGRQGDDEYDCTAIYQVNADGSRFRSGNISGHYRGKKIEFTDGFGVHQVVGDAEQKFTVPYNCRHQGQGDGIVCSYRTYWEPIARRID